RRSRPTICYAAPAICDCNAGALRVFEQNHEATYAPNNECDTRAQAPDLLELRKRQTVGGVCPQGIHESKWLRPNERTCSGMRTWKTVSNVDATSVRTFHQCI